MDHRMDWARAAAYWLMGAKHLVIEAIKNNLHTKVGKSVGWVECTSSVLKI
jgi:hypothetical protein